MITYHIIRRSIVTLYAAMTGTHLAIGAPNGSHLALQIAMLSVRARLCLVSYEASHRWHDLNIDLNLHYFL